MKQISNRTFDQERALYGSRELLVKDCAFDGPADGESAFKESAEIAGGALLFQPALPVLARPRAANNATRR